MKRCLSARERLLHVLQLAVQLDEEVRQLQMTYSIQLANDLVQHLTLVLDTSMQRAAEEVGCKEGQDDMR